MTDIRNRQTAAIPLSAEVRARNFELMLNRIIYRHCRGLDITPTIVQARDLIRRTGSGVFQRRVVGPLSAPIGSGDTAEISNDV